MTGRDPFLRPEEPERGERRRAHWREFRHAYPGILAVVAVALVVLLALDVWLVMRRQRYAREIERLRSSMTDAERRRADMLGAESENKLRIMVELVRRQSAVDKELHLSVAVDSGMMYLERDGALLREMRVEVGPERAVGTVPDTVRIVVPRGARTVERLVGATDAWEVPRWVYSDRGIAEPAERTLKGALGPSAIVLTGGTVIYAMPSVGPLNDSSYVMPGAVRARASDLEAIAPNLAPGVTVYLY
jgi:hypothetical protein